VGQTVNKEFHVQSSSKTGIGKKSMQTQCEKLQSGNMLRSGSGIISNIPAWSKSVFLLLVKFLILATKRKSPCDRYKGRFWGKNDTLSSHCEKLFLNLPYFSSSMSPTYSMIPKLF
jgi:hypothetical protein